MLKLFCLILLSLSIHSVYAQNKARIIDNPREALEIRMQLIQEAQYDISISYFIFAKDKTAVEFLALLRKKAREGVRVRILVDDLFNDIPRSMGTHLAHEKVEIKNFNKKNVLKLGKTLKYRLHDKLFIVDSKVVILGGRNIEDTYYSRAEKNYDDRDVYVQGELATTAQKYYDELWEAKHLTPFKTLKTSKPANQKKIDNSILELDKHEEHIRRKSLKTLNIFNLHLEPIDHMTLLRDEISPVKRKLADSVSGTAFHLYEYINKANESVIIDSPYLILTKELESLLQSVIARGVKVRILTNSLKATDGIVPQAAYIGQRKKMVRMGIELYEYFGEDSFHSKSLVIDNKIAIIGSFNFDPRSQNLNTETMSVFYDHELAQQLTDSMNKSLQISYLVDQNGRPVGHEKKYPGVKLSKVILTKLIQFLVVPYAKGLL
jgi:putative cardiolipin synthase